ncbi:MAG: UV-damage endonuclease [Phylliscum demangeonii]|nr:MAG: UV-damage endonuclease [Phylliscum demangeonii]
MARRRKVVVAEHVVAATQMAVTLSSEETGRPTHARKRNEPELAEIEAAKTEPIQAETDILVPHTGRVLRASRTLQKEDVKVAPGRRSFATVATVKAGKTADDGLDSSLSDLSEVEVEAAESAHATKSTPARKGRPKKTSDVKPSGRLNASAAAKVEGVGEVVDPEADEEEEVSVEQEVEAAVARPPPVHSDYLPLPWRGRLGYACLCTYLRYSNPSVFSSRTTRIASIIERQHPLKDPSAPYHAIKNRPDREQAADTGRGRAFVEDLGLANARDIVKMIRWNDRYGIKFLRLSSEMFPFASHPVYGYQLAPFASGVLAEAGRVAGELGHRLTTHPGQFTQLGSPRKSVIENAIRDLEYHAELLSLLKLPEQANRDAVMILHMGGVFGDKEATLNRFRENYQALSQGIKDRLVLENDDVSWSVHELLPICEELNIPLVLDYHHHNIIHSDQVREGTMDIMPLYDRIKQTWTRKAIRQKMHYSEPEPKAVTARQRRKHSPRVATLPPCDPEMDLMIEAKDKEQAVFELMRTFKLPGWRTFSDIIPHFRVDENRAAKKAKAPKKKSRKKTDEAEVAAAEDVPPEEEAGAPVIAEEEIGMGGPDGRVYWPPGMEEWLRPAKRVVTKKDPDDPNAAPGTTKKRKATKQELDEVTPAKKKATVQLRKTSASKKKVMTAVAAPDTLDEDSSEGQLPDLSASPSPMPAAKRSASARKSGRVKKVNYAEESE